MLTIRSRVPRAAPILLVTALAVTLPAHAADPDAANANNRSAGIVTIVGIRSASSLPSNIPTTVEGITGAEIEARINATDSEDALKYFPSLLVRKRYIGDYNHAVLSSRASGTGNSARSMVYADGVLLSNFLGNGATFTPRWGLVTPEEIDRVDVLYGPFSAAYAGNSVGAVVDYVTRMPSAFEAHVKAGFFVQPFALYGTRATYQGWQASASLGDRAGDFSWWMHLKRLDSEGQPLTFVTRLVGATTTTPGTAVDGAVLDADKSRLPWYLLGDATQVRTVQDHAKLKLAWDLGSGLRVQGTLGWWVNRSAADSHSYLTRTADGTAFVSGVAGIGGRNYALSATDFGQSREGLAHAMAGVTARRHTGGVFDWTLAASTYDYRRDLSRTPTVAKPAADAGGAGRLTDLAGTGWTSLSAKAIWRPTAAHQLDLGVQQERYRWRQRIDNAADWMAGAATTPVSAFQGDTELRSVFVQDAWAVDTRWKAVLGLRAEDWKAYAGRKSTGTAAPVAFQDRHERYLSPKAAVGFQVDPDLSLKLSTGRAVRMPTVGELFQGNAGSDVVTRPDLKPEKSWTRELSAEWTLAGRHRLRTTLFHEDTRDALYTQAIAGTTPLVNSVQNIDRIRTLGLETMLEAKDLLLAGLGVQASVTYADSVIVANSSYVSTPGDTIGRQQPRVPHWRASVLLSYALTPAWQASLGARYGSRQYGTLNNSDTNGHAYQGFSPYLTADLRVRWKLSRQLSAAFGIDNLNNATYWNFHPYPQRTYSAEVRFDL